MGVGVAVTDRGRILLIQRAHEPGKGLWAVPGGKVRLGETLEAAARREVEEETSLQVAIGPVIWAGETIGEFGHIVLVDFLGTITGGELAASDDADDAVWIDLNDVETLPLTPTMHELVAVLRDRMS